jgi:hypothetical protein
MRPVILVARVILEAAVEVVVAAIFRRARRVAVVEAYLHFGQHRQLALQRVL